MVVKWGEGPYWLTTKQESSPEILTKCDHPNCPPRTTRATSVPHAQQFDSYFSFFQPRLVSNRTKSSVVLAAPMFSILIPIFAWPHHRRGLASDGVRYVGARSSVGRRFRSVTKLRLEWNGGFSLLLQQRSKHPREMVITPKASTSFYFNRPSFPTEPRVLVCSTNQSAVLAAPMFNNLIRMFPFFYPAASH